MFIRCNMVPLNFHITKANALYKTLLFMKTKLHVNSKVHRVFFFFFLKYISFIAQKIPFSCQYRKNRFFSLTFVLMKTKTCCVFLRAGVEEAPKENLNTWKTSMKVPIVKDGILKEECHALNSMLSWTTWCWPTGGLSHQIVTPSNGPGLM